MDLLLFVIGVMVAIASVIWLVVSLMRKSFDKRAVMAFSVSIVVMIVALFMPMGNGDKVAGDDDVIEELEEVEEPNVVEEPVEDEPKEVVEEAENQEPDTTWDDLKENIVGVSDKDFKEVIEGSPTDVRNDTTGNWKKLVMSKGLDMEEYAASYAKTNMEKNEIHFIIDFGRNTTTSINKMGGLLYVDIMEYVDKEEHDANKLGSGMLLQSYMVCPDGDIEKVEY